MVAELLYPSAPTEPKPQQRTVSSSSSAQVWALPAVIAFAVRPAPRFTGPALPGDSSSPIVSELP